MRKTKTSGLLEWAVRFRLILHKKPLAVCCYVMWITMIAAYAWGGTAKTGDTSQKQAQLKLVEIRERVQEIVVPHTCKQTLPIAK